MLEVTGDWVQLAGLAVAVATLVATIVIARNTNRVSRQIHEENQRREKIRELEGKISGLQLQKSEIRALAKEFHTDAETWNTRARAFDGELQEPTPTGEKLVAKAEETGHDPHTLLDLIRVLEGHSFWQNNPAERRQWVNRTSTETETDAEWSAGYVNSALDVVKDSVIEPIDRNHIIPAFWIEIDERYFDENGSAKSQEIEQSAESRATAIERWVPRNIEQESQRRITALTNYKSSLEHKFACMLSASFVHSNEVSRTERFQYAMTSTYFQILKEIGNESDRAIDSLDKEIHELTQQLNVSVSASPTNPIHGS